MGTQGSCSSLFSSFTEMRGGRRLKGAFLIQTEIVVEGAGEREVTGQARCGLDSGLSHPWTKGDMT